MNILAVGWSGRGIISDGLLHNALRKFLDQKLTRYEQLASDALAGEIVGSSAGGEQPKFTCYAQTPSGNKHVLVKFTVPQQTAVSQRWGTC